jgi:hypothetical protein
MIKSFYILCCWTLLVQAAIAQDLTQTVKGKVVDAVLDQPLPGATIQYDINGETKGTAADINGEFRLEKVPVGRHTFKVQMMGYEEMILPNILVSSGKETYLTIKLTESVVTMNEVVVNAEGEKGEMNNQMSTVSARSFSVEETKRYAGSFDDPARMAQSFAGVSSNNDSSNEIVIRGNSPRGVLWKLEGIEIPNPNHFADQGASGGAISMLSSNMMTNSDFFTGAFPSEYGNALSGVFDISLRKGNKDKREYAFQAGVLGLDVAMEGYFKKGYDGSYLINYRYSTLSLLNTLGLNIVGDAVPVFQDLCFNFFIPTKKIGNFSVFGLGGISSVQQEWQSGNSLFKDKFRLRMGVAGLTHTFFVSKNSFVKTVITVNNTSNFYENKKHDSTGIFLFTDYRQNFINEGARGTITFHSKLNANHTFKTGIIYSVFKFDYFSESFWEEDMQFHRWLDQSGNSGLMQGFASWKFRINRFLTLNSGLHYTYFLLNKSNNLEPRAGIKWQINQRHSLSFGGGLHSRIEDITLYMASIYNEDSNQIFPNRNLKPTKAVHAVAGYDLMLTENAHVKAEIYYQYLYDVPVIDVNDGWFSALNYAEGFTTDSLVNKGTGYNYGIEFTLERYFTDDWFFMLTHSLYQSKYRMPDGREFNTRYNGNYATTIVGGKEFKAGKSKNHILSITTRGTWAGGRRFTPILLDSSITAGYEIFDETAVFRDKQKDYLRLDLQLSYKINKKKTTQTWKVDAQNILNRKNVYATYFDAPSGELRTSYQLGFVPVISYKVEF